MTIIVSKKNKLYLNPNVTTFFSDSDFFIDIGSDYKPSKEYLTMVSGLIDNKNIKKDRIFFDVFISKNSVKQGWKIHVSAIPGNAQEILMIVSKICILNKTNFKFLCDSKLLVSSLSKNWSRSESGKFITIYPESIDKFKKILSELYSKLSDYVGPYILSDKRYKKDCQVLYYRYGGFILQTKFVNTAEKEPFIIDKNGRKHIDLRLPYYYQPVWVKDPFTDEFYNQKAKKKQLTNLELDNNKYKIEKVIKHTNSGGIYLSQTSKRNVVIKEARPSTSVNLKNEDDATNIRYREWKILKTLEKDKVDCVPRPIEIFNEWENTFLVESLIDGQDLQSFIAINNPLVSARFYSNKDQISGRLKHYFYNVKKIDVNLIKLVRNIHNSSIYLGDLSTFNIIVDNEFKAFFPDLEGAGYIDNPNEIDNFTPGFRLKSKSKHVINDYFALGSIMINMLLPINFAFSLDNTIIERFLSMFEKDLSLPYEFGNVIRQLIYHPESTDLNKLEKTISKISFENIKVKDNIKKYSKQEIKKELSEINNFIFNHINYKNYRNIIPGSGERADSLNILNGVAGLIHYVNSNSIEYNQKATLDNILVSNLDKVQHLGLFDGLSGIAWVLLEEAKTKEAEIILKKVNTKIKKLDLVPGMKSGLAGIGMTNIYFYKKLHKKKYLNEAIEIKNRLFTTMEQNTYEINWGKKCGFAEGGSGIALFILILACLTQDNFLLKTSEKAIQFDLDNVIDDGLTISLKRSSNSKTVSPYLFTGTAGLVAVLLRFYNVTGNDKYKKEIYKLSEDILRKYSYLPGYCDGLCGIGMTLLDCYYYLNDKKYLDAAWRIYDVIRLYAIKKNDGMAFPGDLLLKLSNDLESGSIGIALFYKRLIENKKQHDFFLDEIVRENKNEFL